MKPRKVSSLTPFAPVLYGDPGNSEWVSASSGGAYQGSIVPNWRLNRNEHLCSVLPTGTGQPCHGKHASHTPVPYWQGLSARCV